MSKHLERFLDRFVPEPNSGCWLWDRATSAAGYGQFLVEDKVEYAHRYSYRTFNGPIAVGQEVRHTCDVRCCVNPDHLIVGSHADNMMDMALRRRGNKLTDRQVLEILADPRPKKEIAKEYGIALSYVYHIKTGIANRRCVKEHEAGYRR